MWIFLRRSPRSTLFLYSVIFGLNFLNVPLTTNEGWRRKAKTQKFEWIFFVALRLSACDKRKLVIKRRRTGQRRVGESKKGDDSTWHRAPAGRQERGDEIRFKYFWSSNLFRLYLSSFSRHWEGCWLTSPEISTWRLSAQHHWPTIPAVHLIKL